MGLKIGETMHLMDIDENTLVWDNILYTQLLLKQMILNITFPYMYDVFNLQNMNLVFLQFTKIPFIFITLVIFKHFCDMFVVYYIISIAIFY
jgi:hypothetical protein